MIPPTANNWKNNELAQGIDVLEESILSLDDQLLEILLSDHTTQKNIIWATADYTSFGDAFGEHCEIKPELVTGQFAFLIQPRITKSQNTQLGRTRDKAEVFTPSWICNKQNNLIDQQWFGRENVFNVESGQVWIASEKSVSFEGMKKSWQKYVDAQRLEIACGEAPYLVSRYDTVTGERIPISQRIGLLDRKMRIVRENTTTAESWLKWAQRAFESVYGFEYQGDNLLLARENLLYSYIEYYDERFQAMPEIDLLRKIARIISWNIWQMDGLTYLVPGGSKPVESCQLSMFDHFNDDGFYLDGNSIQGSVNAGEDQNGHPGGYCRIMDWRSKRSQTFLSLMKGGKP